MNLKEKENIIKLEPFKRYQYFIKKIADFEELWTIVNENGDYAISEVDDHSLISFWTAEEFILSNLDKGWENYRPLKICLEDLENELFKIIASENYLVNVFPINGKSGFVVSLEEFRRDLNEELDKIQ
ncbi:hypothetical protein IQ37_19550 [Chryseobacterium piperi]|uniref:DUF2750 domain-containing protein n=1 Tax=Chryseobacterium piperi TaxID=558152 RepID=A0A086A374_9FLAO|nr:DUF2750 domain-containing protein [Chryseobacterium piperi]ASW73695.1 DUF2750 domain-containing protein [Chryseobacterium piperi]KFF11138.1 hypothetical protein IQ37_19550 [Chryseobacterium piperi]